MHTPETRQRFLELRAQGRTLASLAEQLNVTPRTLFNWHHQYRAQINAFRNLRLEALQEKLLASHENELATLANQLQRVDQILAQRDWECLATEFLVSLATGLRSKIRKQRLNPVFEPLPDSEPTGDAPNPPLAKP
jgi:transposase-like protein